MIRVHHLNNSRSQRVLWLLEELGMPYEVVRYERKKATMLAPKELKRVHPLGKSPVIEDDGKKFAETGLIVEYLVERYGPDLAAAGFRSLLAPQILAALRRRLTDAAAPHQAYHRPARPVGAAGKTLREIAVEAAPRLSGGRAERGAVVRRRALLRRRYHAEFSA
jgi:glutathione S-transferase